jgi:hypothetical protein
VYLNHRGGLAGGLGQPSAFTEQALHAKMSELEKVRAEADAVQAEITAIRTGRPVQRASQAQATAPAPAMPGGSVDLPVVGRVPTLAVVGVGLAAVIFARRRR